MEVSADLALVLMTLLTEVGAVDVIFAVDEFMSVKLTQLPRRLPRFFGIPPASKSLSQGAESLLTKRKKNGSRFSSFLLKLCKATINNLLHIIMLSLLSFDRHNRIYRKPRKP